jgi:hypothetical protein
VEYEANEANLLKSEYILYMRTGATEVLLGTSPQHNAASLTALNESPYHAWFSYNE